jgi:prepilin-type N-terminal cleavage/methylation domain-containing protein
MKTTRRNGKAAFTLIELMAVITIIVILAGLVVGGMGFVTERQAKEKARVQIALLSKGLEEYKLDMGAYPATANSPLGASNSAEYLYKPLFKEGYDYTNPASPPASWTKATKIYVAELNPVTSKQGWVTTATGTPPVSTTVLDPWGKEYCYRSAVTSAGAANVDTQNPDFDLWSMGKDGKTKPGTPSDSTNRDDIKNF